MPPATPVANADENGAGQYQKIGTGEFSPRSGAPPVAITDGHGWGGKAVEGAFLTADERGWEKDEKAKAESRKQKAEMRGLKLSEFNHERCEIHERAESRQASGEMPADVWSLLAQAERRK